MKILLLTDFTFYEKFKRLVNTKLRRRHGGEMVVLRSLRSGLQALGHDVDCMPKKSVFYDLCHVISGDNSWNWAVSNREKFASFVAGPNLITLPNEILQFHERHLLGAYIQPSQWVRQLFITAEEFLNIKVIVWACGVDSRDWVDKKCKKNHYLIYIKNKLSITNEVMNRMDKLGIKYKTIYYGAYSKKEYKKLLHESKAMIYISESESQGVALLEAWSCNVPTFVYQATTLFGDKQIAACSAPYLNDLCGNFFSNVEDLLHYLRDPVIVETKNPREFILDNFTDEICAKKYLEVALSEE